MSPKSTPLTSITSEILQSINNKGVNSNEIPTGFVYFDKEFIGLTLGELVVIGGRPGMGKTQFAINLVANICENHPVLFFSFDLTPYSLSARMLSHKTSIPVNSILNKTLAESEIEKLKEASVNLENSKLFISETGISNVDEIISIIKEHVDEYGTQIVVIDYLQLLSNSRHNNGREAEIGYLCKKIKICAKELNICIVLLSQLSRAVENRSSSKKPQLYDLRDSGAIEQLADKVWLLYRPEYYLIEVIDDGECSSSDGILVMIVAKNKNGKIGEVYFKRNESFTKFDYIKKAEDNFEFNEERLSELEIPTFTELKNNDNEVPF